jgi:hypothetical protein
VSVEEWKGWNVCCFFLFFRLMKYPKPSNAVATAIATRIQSIVGSEGDAVFVPPGVVVVGGFTGSRKVPVLVVWFVSPG